VESFEEINMILEKFHDINLLKLPNSPLTMRDIQHVIDLKQHAPHPLMIDIQYNVSV
jgi:hypothetical protein